MIILITSSDPYHIHNNTIIVTPSVIIIMWEKVTTVILSTPIHFLFYSYFASCWEKYLPQ